MDLAEQYRRQYGWRAWADAYDALPELAGARVLDLGCAVGDQAAALARRGAQVVGVDGNEQLLALAKARGIEGADFHAGDLRDPQVGDGFDGIWASFAAAYFPDFGHVLSRWSELLRPGGWIALTEVSGLFEHKPIPVAAQQLLRHFARESAAAGRYDFDMGAKLTDFLSAAGFAVTLQRTLADRELSFEGPAEPEVLQAWAARLQRMHLLRQRAAQDCPSLADDLLACLGSADHSTQCRVHFVIATNAASTWR